MSGGSQNEIYEIRRGELHAALRIPPPSAPQSRDDGIVREWRITEALDGTDVPHTPAIGMCCDDMAVLGRSFYLMGFVDGWSPMGVDKWPAPFDTDLEARKGFPSQLAEGIALLSRVDWQAKGLEGLGRPDGFHERQVERWTTFFERIKGRDLPGIEVASAWLASHRPIDYIPGIMHGDYQFANVMYRHGAPAQLAAIVDWEMGTVGDPKLDLAWMVSNRGPRTPTPPTQPGGDPRYVDMTGMPTRSEVLRRLRSGLGETGRRHRLLRHPGQVEAGHRALNRGINGPPTTRSCRYSGPSSSGSWIRRPSWRNRPPTRDKREGCGPPAPLAAAST